MQQREARAANYVLASFVIVSLTLLSLPLAGPVQAFKACATYVLTPIAYYGDKGYERFANVPGRLRDLITADMENHAVKEQLKQTDWVKTEIDSLRVENTRLRAALGLKAPSSRGALWAHVLERDPRRWYHSFTVDAGSEQGVSLNAPVLGGTGGKIAAIGRIIEVRPKNSVVLLLTDELSSAAAYVVSPATTTPAGEPVEARSFEGLLQGQGKARLRMNYLSPDAEIKNNDLVYTSPTSATFPPDILLGTVANVYALDPFLAFQSVEVKPALDASTLKEVMILKQASASAKLAESARAAMGTSEPEPEPEEGAQP